MGRVGGAFCTTSNELVGNACCAAAFAFSINGTEGLVLGRAGEAVTVHITPQNYREFLSR